MEEGVPRVRKISAYSPAKIGDDFWVVSAVVDYDDFYRPILDGFSGLFPKIPEHAKRLII